MTDSTIPAYLRPRPCSRCGRAVPADGTGVSVGSRRWAPTPDAHPDWAIEVDYRPSGDVAWLLCGPCVTAVNAFVFEPAADGEHGLPALQVVPLPDGRFAVRAYYSDGRLMANSTFDDREEAEEFGLKIARAL